MKAGMVCIGLSVSLSREIRMPLPVKHAGKEAGVVAAKGGKNLDGVLVALVQILGVVAALGHVRVPAAKGLCGEGAGC